jgi:hypothetical protein
VRPHAGAASRHVLGKDFEEGLGNLKALAEQ